MATNDMFSYKAIGNVALGRENLGESMPVSVYRLFEYAIRQVLEERYSEDEAIDIFRQTGRKTGVAFAEQFLDLDLPLGAFIAQLQEALKLYKIGIMRIEKYDELTGNATLTISEDLDCSGLNVTGKTVCNYDEGFIAGILYAYTGKVYVVTEIDCWATGARECRFLAEVCVDAPTGGING